MIHRLIRLTGKPTARAPTSNNPKKNSSSPAHLAGQAMEPFHEGRVTTSATAVSAGIRAAA